MRQALWTWASCAKKLRQRPFAWRHFHSTRSRQHLSGGLKPALRASPEFASLGGEPSIYLAWRVPNVNLAQKNPLPFLWGRGWGLNKTAQRQNPAFTSLGGFPSCASGQHRPGGLKRCWFAAIRVGVFSALGFVLAKENPRFAGFLVCVVLCFSQC